MNDADALNDPNPRNDADPRNDTDAPNDPNPLDQADTPVHISFFPSAPPALRADSSASRNASTDRTASS